VAPALLSVEVPAGTDHVAFPYHGYHGYAELLALSGPTLAIVALAPICLRRRRHSAHEARLTRDPLCEERL
jgi:hypothetical protein